MKPLKLILPILFLSSLAFGQGSFASFTVQTPTGNAIAGASVALCTSLPTASTPCGQSTLQTTYVDITAAVQCTKNALVLGPLNGVGCTNPGYTDNFGNAQIFALAGLNYYQTWGYGIANAYVSPLPFPALTAGVGTINNVTAINGLFGGGIGPSVNIGLITSCPANNVLLWNGQTWNCSTAGSGTLTGATTAGTSGLIGGGLTGTIALSMRTDCAATQTEVWSGTSWNCGANGTGTVTGVTATSGGGLVAGGTAQAPTLGLITSCGNNQVLQWNASSWVCATIAGGAGTPGGATTQVQVNNSGAFAGYPFLTVNSGTSTVNMTNGSVSNQFTVAGPHFINSTWPSSLPGVCAFGVGSCPSTTSFGFDQAGHLSELGFNNATGGGEYLLSNPAANQTITQAVNTTFAVNNISNIRYVTPSYNFSQSPAADLSAAGAGKTITLTPCPIGIDVSANANKPYRVYIATQGTPEAALVTGGTCTSGGTTGTVIVTTVNTHAAGYTVASAYAGIQEALNAAGSPNAQVIIPPTGANANAYKIYATIYMQNARSLLSGYGALLNCQTRDVCLFLGDRVSVGNFASATVQGLRFTSSVNVDGVQVTNAAVTSGNLVTLTATAHPFVIGDWIAMRVSVPRFDSYNLIAKVTGATANTFSFALTRANYATTAAFGTAALENTAIEDNSEDADLQDISMSSVGFPGVFHIDLVTDNDQGELIHHFRTEAGAQIRTGANWVGWGVWIRGDSGNAGVVTIDGESDFSMACANGIFYNSGNLLTIRDTVIQAYSQHAVFQGGGLQGGLYDNVYTEIGSCPNPLYPGSILAASGLTNQGQFATSRGGTSMAGQSPSFLAQNVGGTQRNYYIVATSSIGPVSTVPLFAGYCLTTGVGTCTIYWPQMPATVPGIDGTITYDVLVGTSATLAPLGTGNFSVATGISGGCVNGICTLVDTVSVASSAYTVSANPTLVPQLSEWPGHVVLSPAADTNTLTIPAFFSDTLPANSASTLIAASSFPAFYAHQCAAGGGSFPSIYMALCKSTTGLGYNAIQNGSAFPQGGGGLASNTKGALIFMGNGAGQTHIITLRDSNQQKTLASNGIRPANDANDVYIGNDDPASYNNLTFGAPGAISNYIANTGDNTSWLERLTATNKTLKVALTVPDVTGMVFVDGNKFTNLCGAMAYAAANTTRRSKIYDLNAYEAWTKDPFNDATCGNFASTNVSPQVYLGLGNFINGTGGTIHIPTGVELYLGGRASENQLSTSTGCGTATPTSCTGTLIIAYSTAAPFTGGNAMTCGSCTLFPINTPVIDFGAAPSFGALIQGPGSISCAGVAGSTGIANAQAQEQSFLFHLAIVGCQAFAVDWNGSAAQNSWIDDLEILSGNLTGGTIGTPTAFIGVRISINAPNRHYGNFTCNTRGAATTLPVTACVKVINSRGGRVHDVHYENANYGVVVDGSSNVLLQNINTSAASVDASTPVALVKNCASGSAAPCTSGVSSTNLVVHGLQRTSPNITTNAVVDDNVIGGTIAWANWTGEYNQAVPQFGAFPATVTVGSGTSTSNGTAIASGVSQAQPAITVTGATVTDVATCSLNAAPVATWQTGIQLLPAVVTANTVTPWLSNPTAGSITPAATAIRCTVTR